MPNPLDLPGPQFLLFYLVVGVAVLVGLWVLRSASEGGAPPRLDTSDPYLIAFLRGGKNEALRVATVSLVDRGLLDIDAKDALHARSGAADAAARPIDNALLGYFGEPRGATEIFNDGGLEAACAEYQVASRGWTSCPTTRRSGAGAAGWPSPCSSSWGWPARRSGSR